MKNGFLLGVLILGIVVILVFIVVEIIVRRPLMAESQIPTLSANLPTETAGDAAAPAAIITTDKPEVPSPTASATATREVSHLDTVIQLIGLTEVVIPTNTPKPTKTPKPTPIVHHADELLGEYYCSGIEAGLLATWGRVILKEDGTLETIQYYGQGNNASWRYDEKTKRIEISPDSFFLDFGVVHSFDKKNIGFTFHPWATDYMVHAETGTIDCIEYKSP